MDLNIYDWAKTASTGDFLFVASMLLLASIGCFFFAFKFFREKRIITDTPTSKIRSAAQGYVELVGRCKLLDGAPITSPTGTDCLWYDFQIEMASSNSQGRYWRTVRAETSSELFLLRDETGECIIDPESAEVTVVDEMVWYGNSDRLLKRPSKTKKLSLFYKVMGGSYRYTERLLHKNEKLYAIGLFKTVGGVGATFNAKEGVRDLIWEWKQDTAALLEQFDKNKDGEIDLKEWEQVREAAYKEVLKKHSHQQTLPPVNLISKTQDKRRPYLLSALEQSKLVQHLHYYAIACFVGFFLSGIFVTFLISWRLSSG